jgi:hypothetical protein
LDLGRKVAQYVFPKTKAYFDGTARGNWSKYKKERFKHALLWTLVDKLISSDSQSICDAVNIVKPRSD